MKSTTYNSEFIGYVDYTFTSRVDTFISKHKLHQESIYQLLTDECLSMKDRIRNMSSYLWNVLNVIDKRKFQKQHSFGKLLLGLKERGATLEEIGEVIKAEINILQTTDLQFEELQETNDLILAYMKTKNLNGIDYYKACFNKSKIRKERP